MYNSNSRQQKKFEEVYYVSAKTSRTVTCLQKILGNIDIMDLFLLPFLCSLFKWRLESVTMVFMFEVVLANLKIPEPTNVL